MIKRKSKHKKKTKLYLGDCLDVMKGIPDNSIDLVVTDPPYKMTKQGNSCRPNYMKSGMGYNLFSGSLIRPKDWLPVCFAKLKDDTHFYSFCNLNDLELYLKVLKDSGFKIHNILTMRKNTKMPNRWYLKYTEFIIFARKGKAKPINDMTSRDYFDVNMPTNKNGKLHITQKPLILIEKLIFNSSFENQTILDPFMGSGTSGVACKQLNRDFIGIELDETYFNISQRRIKATQKGFFPI